MVHPGTVLELLRRATGIIVAPYHALGIVVWPSREISRVLGYERDHVATLLRGGSHPATPDRDYLLFEGEALATFRADYAHRLDWQSLAAERLMLLTASGLLEAMCRAGTEAGRRARRIIVDEAERTGAGMRAMGLLMAGGPKALEAATLRRPRLEVLDGGRSGT